MGGQILGGRRVAVLSAACACALALPLAAQAQSTPAAGMQAQGGQAQTESEREQQLTQRVAQLEQELQQLKQAVQAQAQRVAPTPPAPPPATVSAPTFSSAPGVSVAFHGFISASSFWQDQNFTFGNGQNAEWPTGNTDSKHKLSGVEVRNTRVWLDLAGVTLPSGWSASARLEADVFGGFNGTGAYSAQQETPRLRQAYVKLASADGSRSLTIGQQWDLLFPGESVPLSLTHIAFPLGFGTGMIGWRFPGVVYSQNLGQQSPDAAAWRLDLGVFSGSWSGPGDNVNFGTAANADFRPQVEARLHVKKGDLTGYLVGHYSRVDLAGVGGGAPTPIKSKITSSALEVGTTWTPGPWSLRAAAYTGNGLGQVFGAMAQFGDISETGGYVQGGYKFNSNWGLYATYAADHPDKDDVIAWLGEGARGSTNGRQYALDLLYGDGPFGFGFEWMRGQVDTFGLSPDTLQPVKTSSDGNQFSVSAIYHF